jgi:FlaA1/EpsC-like NDP-sugar epimerase
MAQILSKLRAVSGSRFLVLFVSYTLVLGASIWVAYQVRFDFDIPKFHEDEILLVFLWIVALKLVFLFLFRQFAGLLTYFSTPDLKRVFVSLLLASIVMSAVTWLFGVRFAPPRGVILIDFIVSFLGVAGLRLAFRVYREQVQQLSVSSGSRNARRVGIIGAGDVGARLAQELMVKKGLGLKPVAFFDDDPKKWGSRIHGIPVVGAGEVLLDRKSLLQLDEAIIAMPAASGARINQVVKLLQQAKIRFETVPSLDQLATGKVRLTQFRPVEIQDLLGRKPVALETAPIARLIRGKVVMVTGAGGSIGSELCRQIAQYEPKKLVLVDQSEVQMFLIERELVELGYTELIVPEVADVTDRARLGGVFRDHGPELIFHAAAHKHVPLMEMQPAEAIRNNTFGTATVAELAAQFGVERFVLISTDKAINPTNVMGATKRLAEIFVQAFQAEHPKGTKFMAVRFGNVLGSSGSVIPTFRKQIAAGGPVRVTHRDVTRYFMTIPESVGLVLQSATQGEGGDIFVLDMGEPIKIVDLARQMIELSGFHPDEDIAIEFVGLRPGEKMFEELSYNSEYMDRTQHPKVMRLKCNSSSLSHVRTLLGAIESELYTSGAGELKLLLKTAVPEYQPYFETADPVSTSVGEVTLPEAALAK